MKVNTYVKEGLNFIEVVNDSFLRVIFCDLGASIFNIYFYNESMTHNVKDIKDYKESNCYYGKTVGRTSNRLKGYRFIIDDKIYNLEPNEGVNVLHGGVNGLSTKSFKAKVNTYPEYIEVLFNYTSPHLEAGYPGKVDIEVKYLVYKAIDKLEVRYNAKSDANTLFSLTNHAYFSLGDKDISNLDLYIRGHKYLNVDKSNLIAVDIKDINEVMDFTKYKRISKDINSDYLKGKMMNGYDSYWYFDENNANRINVSLRNDKYRMDIYTDFKGVQIYSSNYEPPFDLDNEIKYRDSVAIEPSDSFYKPNVLLKGQTYSRNITYLFIKK